MPLNALSFAVDPVAALERVEGRLPVSRHVADVVDALERQDLDVDHVVGEPAAVREALDVATDDAEPAGLSSGCRRARSGR